jgi:hypothetical protein
MKPDKSAGGRYWMGSQPEQCDLCQAPLDGEFVDGATVRGPWAMMCVKCHRMFGHGLGMGRGQRYELGDQDRWWKTGG